jgi:hypothetical protein
MSYKVCVVPSLHFIEICCACAVQTTQTTQHQSAERVMSSNSSPIYQKSTKYSHLMPYTPLCILQVGSNMTGTNCDLFTHKSSRSYLSHLVYYILHISVLLKSPPETQREWAKKVFQIWKRACSLSDVSTLMASCTVTFGLQLSRTKVTLLLWHWLSKQSVTQRGYQTRDVPSCNTVLL